MQWTYAPDDVTIIGAVFWNWWKRGTINIYATSGVVTVTGGSRASRDAVIMDMAEWTKPWEPPKKPKTKQQKQKPQREKRHHSGSDILALGQQNGFSAPGR